MPSHSRDYGRSGSVLTPLHVALIEHLLSGKTFKACCLAVGCSDRALRKWMKPGHHFRKALDRARADQDAGKEAARKIAAEGKGMAQFNAACLLFGVSATDVRGKQSEHAKGDTKSKATPKFYGGPAS